MHRLLYSLWVSKGPAMRAQAPNFVSLKGYGTASPFRIQIFVFFLLTTCSTKTSRVCAALNFRMKRGSQSSLATPRSLQHLIIALDLQPSVAVGMPSGEK
jgi:hypothetical protein